MNQQIDIAVDLGTVAAPLPEILSLRELIAETLHVWNLRRHNADMTLLRPKLEGFESWPPSATARKNGFRQGSEALECRFA